MRFARWIMKATDTHSAYVKIIAITETIISQKSSTLPLYVHSLSYLLTELHMTKSEALFYVF
jgi:hypothetical protein